MFPLTIEKVAELTGTRITNPQAAQVFEAAQADKQRADNPGAPSIETLVCKKLKQNPDIVFASWQRSRRTEIVQARQFAVYFYVEFFALAPDRIYNMSKSKIARHFFRNHATILGSCKTIQNLIDTDKWFATLAAQLRIEIKQHLEANTLSVLP